MILCAAFLLLTAAAASAEDSGEDLLNKLRTVPDFKFQNHHEGIGKGTVAVYTAPSQDAYRLGKASCSLEAEIGEAGSAGGWLLVRYKAGKQMHTGYVNREKVGSFKTRMPHMEGETIPLTAAKDIPVTDGPVEKYVPFGTIRAGETFHVLRKYTYTGSWWYVECTIEGKTARGFIDRNEASFRLGADAASGTVYDLASLGYPEISPRGTKAIGHFEVSEGERKRVRRDPGTKGERISVAYPGRYYPCYEIYEEDGHPWYYIWVEEDSLWAWIAAVNGEFIPD